MKADENGNTITIEEIFLQLEDIMEQMEGTDISLDESFRLYQSGIEKLKSCNDRLDEVEKKMQVLNAEGELEDF